MTSEELALKELSILLTNNEIKSLKRLRRVVEDLIKKEEDIKTESYNNNVLSRLNIIDPKMIQFFNDYILNLRYTLINEHTKIRSYFNDIYGILFDYHVLNKNLYVDRRVWHILKTNFGYNEKQSTDLLINIAKVALRINEPTILFGVLN